MALFSEIGPNNVVLRVVVIEDSNAKTQQEGINWCKEFFNGGEWVETWVDGGTRINYGSEGYVYDPINDWFLPPQPYPSWHLDESKKYWDAPVPYPNDGHNYQWDEQTLSWVETVGI
jgi:hypothetical protein